MIVGRCKLLVLMYMMFSPWVPRFRQNLKSLAVNGVGRVSASMVIASAKSSKMRSCSSTVLMGLGELGM